MGYLSADVRKRKNLAISTRTQITELLCEDLRCVGIKARIDGKLQEFHGREVILSSGAIHSPAHLLRAGIGPTGHLHDLGIPVRHASFGVGQRLMDHPSVALAAFIKRSARVKNHLSRRHSYLGMRYSSEIGGAPPGDIDRVLALLRLQTDIARATERRRGVPGEPLLPMDRAMLELKPTRQLLPNEIVAVDGERLRPADGPLVFASSYRRFDDDELVDLASTDDSAAAQLLHRFPLPWRDAQVDASAGLFFPAVEVTTRYRDFD